MADLGAIPPQGVVPVAEKLPGINMRATGSSITTAVPVAIASGSATLAPTASAAGVVTAPAPARAAWLSSETLRKSKIDWKQSTHDGRRQMVSRWETTWRVDGLGRADDLQLGFFVSSCLWGGPSCEPLNGNMGFRFHEGEFVCVLEGDLVRAHANITHRSSCCRDRYKFVLKEIDIACGELIRKRKPDFQVRGERLEGRMS